MSRSSKSKKLAAEIYLGLTAKPDSSVSESELSLLLDNAISKDERERLIHKLAYSPQGSSMLAEYARNTRRSKYEQLLSVFEEWLSSPLNGTEKWQAGLAFTLIFMVSIHVLLPTWLNLPLTQPGTEQSTSATRQGGIIDYDQVLVDSKEELQQSFEISLLNNALESCKQNQMTLEKASNVALAFAVLWKGADREPIPTNTVEDFCRSLTNLKR